MEGRWLKLSEEARGGDRLPAMKEKKWSEKLPSL